MFQTWSKQLENGDIWALYREFPLFSSENTFFSEELKLADIARLLFHR
jgi:hypothetical protein